MQQEKVQHVERKTIAAFVRRLPVIHLGIGLLGNAVFIAGAVLYMTKHQDVGTVFFLFGSCGMFLGSLGEIVRVKGRRTLERHDVDPMYPDYPWSEQQSKPSVLD